MAVAGDVRLRVFVRLWGIALVAHVVGNSALANLPGLIGFTNLAVGLVGIALAVRPGRTLLLWASGLVVVSLLAEMPITGNHWFVAGLVSAAALASRGRPESFFPAARLILLVFYSFAAFAKLNSGFLDPSVSCGFHFANQWLDGFGFAPLEAQSRLAVAAVWGPTLTELAVPALLVWRRGRPFGVLLATAFHTAISYDLSQHFYDFTAVLLPLFFLFVPSSTVVKLEREFTILPARLRRMIAHGFIGVGVVGVMAAVAAHAQVTEFYVRIVPFLLWFPFSFWWLLCLARAHGAGEGFGWTLRPAGAVLVAFTFLNGLTAYTEVKTAFAYNMYANLITAGGESNHYIVRRTLPLRSGYAGPVRIVASSDTDLELYREKDYLIAYPEFRRYLAARPEVSVTYERNGAVVVVERAGDDPALSAPVPWWGRFLPLRSIDARRPPRCQDVFLPAL